MPSIEQLLASICLGRTLDVDVVLQLIDCVSQTISVSPLMQQNTLHIREFLKSTPGLSFYLGSYERGETIVDRGVFADTRLEQTLSYANVPLGILLSGEIVIEERNKGIKRLLPGDFLGLFETADFLYNGHNRNIGDWSLRADGPLRVLYFGSLGAANSDQNDVCAAFHRFLIQSARQDICPKPITDLPLLDWLAASINAPRLKDTFVIIHTHLLPSNFPFLRHLAYLIGAENLLVLEKPYSTVPYIKQQVIQMGCEVIPVVMIDQAPYELAVKRSLDLLWEKFCTLGKGQRLKSLVILDDGAEVLLSVPWQRIQVDRVLGVEQTQRGIRRLSTAAAKVPPLVNVAESPVKKQLESTIIAKGVCNKIRSLGLLDKNCHVGIAGTGSIGRAIGKELRLDTTAFAYDVTQQSDCHTNELRRVSSIDTLVNQSDLVIGCTGRDFLAGVCLERIYGKKLLISSSSTDVEFYSILNMASFPSRDFSSLSLDVHRDLELQLLNGGFPINFDRRIEWEYAEDIQLTRCLMYIGFVQSLWLDSKKCGYIEELNKSWQDLLIKKWWELKRLGYGFATHLIDVTQLQLQNQAEQTFFAPDQPVRAL